jgi:HSP20 family protein
MGEALETSGVEGAIGQVEKLYRAVTGREAPPLENAYAPIPAEKDPARHVEEQLDRLLGMLGSTPFSAPSWSPPISVCESDSEVVVCLDLPGVTREQLDVRLQGDVMTVAGQRALVQNGLRLRLNERSVGFFQRTLALPAGAGSGAVAARLRDGVLEVRVPKEVTQSSTSRTISVE